MNNTQSGLFGGLFDDPSKLAALQLLMSGLNPFSKGNEMEPFMRAAALKQKQGELTADRSAMELALTQAGMDPATARALSHNPEAAKLAIQQQQLAGERSADSAIMSGLGGAGGGGSPPSAVAPQSTPGGPINISPEYLNRTRMAESGGNPNAKDPNSSASGYSGFTDATWSDMMKNYPDQGFTPDGRSNRDQADRATALRAQEIGTKLQGAGFVANDQTLRLGHFLGPSGATRFLTGVRENPNAAITDIVSPEAIKANPTIFRNKDGTLKTPEQAFVAITGKFGNAPVVAQGDDEKPVPPPLASARSRGPTPEQIMAMIQKYPNASKETKAKLWDQYNRAVDDQKPTDPQRDYNAIYQQNKALGRPIKPYEEWKLEQAQAGSSKVTIDQKGEGEFEKEFSKDNAKRWGGYIKEGDAAKDRMADINTLRETSRSLGSQGVAANIKLVLGPYAESIGIPVDGLSDIQLWDSVTQKLAPQMRVPGSGSTSDIEFKGMVRAIGKLSNNPEAREKILDTFEAAARNDMARSEIASKLATKEISRSDAEKALRELPDPMTAFRQWRDKNPDAYAEALKGKSSSSKPKTGLDVDGSLANARAAIAKNPAARDAVIQRLRENGIDPSGL